MVCLLYDTVSSPNRSWLVLEIWIQSKDPWIISPYHLFKSLPGSCFHVLSISISHEPSRLQKLTFRTILVKQEDWVPYPILFLISIFSVPPMADIFRLINCEEGSYTSADALGLSIHDMDICLSMEFLKSLAQVGWQGLSLNRILHQPAGTHRMCCVLFSIQIKRQIYSTIGPSLWGKLRQ